jgi:hypothetical protein
MRRSPFPGMDPYLEESWRDVHHSLCTYARDDIQAQLSDGMLARVDERLMVELSPEQARSIYPDVRVVRRPDRNKRNAAPGANAGGVALAEPLTLEIEDEHTTEPFIEIIDARSGGRVITVIEFLSITNKMPGPGCDAYRQEQLELRTAGVSSVEINLLRAGPPPETFPLWMVAMEDRTPYYAVVHRAWAAKKYDVYPMPLQERLSAIAIPLRESDAPVALDLQSLIDRVYRNGAYHVEIDYGRSLHLPLENGEAEWAKDLVMNADVST